VLGMKIAQSKKSHRLSSGSRLPSRSLRETDRLTMAWIGSKSSQVVSTDPQSVLRVRERHTMNYERARSVSNTESALDPVITLAERKYHE
jgi:hypothetical protein